MEELPVITQGYYFLVTLMLGGGAGLIFDFYRTCRSFWKPPRKFTFFIDLFFSIFITLLVFLVLLATNWGEVRLYVFIGIGLGWILYNLTLSKYFLLVYEKILKVFLFLCRVLLRIINSIKNFLVYVFGIILTPFLFLVRIFIKIANIGKQKTKRGTKYIKSYLRKLGKLFFKRKT